MTEEPKPPNDFKLIAIVVLFLICTVLTLILGAKYLKEEKRPYKRPERVTLVKKQDSTKLITWVTFYQNTFQQCGKIDGIGSSGVKCEDGTCAVTQSMMDWSVNYNDSIEIISGPGKGKYRVTDKAAGKSNLVDIFKPLNFKGKFCYKSKIKIISEKP